MGAWSANLYGNDTTCDVRDAYKKLLQSQIANEEAYEKIKDECRAYIGDEDEPLFWYALADTQWRLGRLTPEVKEKTLYWIAKNGGLELWEESKNGGAGWKKTLQKLKETIMSPMPPEKTIKKPIEFIRNPWDIGDVYAYQFHSEGSKESGLFGKFIPIQKIGNEEWYDGWILSRVQIYDKVFDSSPVLDDLKDIRLLPFDTPDLFITGERDVVHFPIRMNSVLESYHARDYPKKHLTYVGNRPDDRRMPLSCINSGSYPWRTIDDWLCYYYQSWRDFDYSVENGGCVFPKASDR